MEQLEIQLCNCFRKLTLNIINFERYSMTLTHTSCLILIHLCKINANIEEFTLIITGNTFSLSPLHTNIPKWLNFLFQGRNTLHVTCWLNNEFSAWFKREIEISKHVLQYICFDEIYF